MPDVPIGVYGDDSLKGGAYNVLASFNASFYKALKQEGFNVSFMKELIAKNDSPALTMAFNAIEIDQWESYLKKGIPHILWLVDSPFMHMTTIQKFQQYKQFICLCVSPIDTEAMKFFFPEVNFLFVPHAVDPEIWHPDTSEKIYDLVFMSSLIKYETEIEDLKKNLPPVMFKIFMEMFDFAIRNPELAFWDIYNIFSDIYEFSLKELSLYYVFFLKLCYAVTYKRRIELIRSLKDFNLKVWGSQLWKDYVTGNVEYMGPAEFTEAADIVRKSKIVLHLQPMQILFGLHERILNAAASGSFAISDHNDQIQYNFGDLVPFYNAVNFEELPDLINYYLNNSDERENKTNQLRQIVLGNHTWNCRAKYFAKILAGN